MQVCDPKRPGTYVPGRRGHLRFEFKKMPGEDSKELEKEEEQKIGTQHNHLYVGSTSDLQKFLKKNGKAEK